jgi:acyl-CoA reductase-like NAD-dependent aldehyde dehydrogenase
MVFVNHYEYFEPGTPFGGFGDSGIGKDLGEESL